MNPIKLNLTAGGSSGGEGSLIASRGSLLGIGTDVAGSIRIPAYCNGLYGFKPTVGRIAYGGQTIGGRAGMVGIIASAGPIGHSVRDLELLLQSVINNTPWEIDEMASVIPWRRIEGFGPERKLRLGLILEDKKYPLHPPVLRAMTEAVKLLKEDGHEVIPLDGQVLPMIEYTSMAWQFFSLDPAKTAMSRLHAAGEPIIKSLTKPLVPGMENFVPSLEVLFDSNIQRAEALESFKKVVLNNKLDAVLLPTYQSTAPPHDAYGLPVYTVLPNFLDVRDMHASWANE